MFVDRKLCLNICVGESGDRLTRAGKVPDYFYDRLAKHNITLHKIYCWRHFLIVHSMTFLSFFFRHSLSTSPTHQHFTTAAHSFPLLSYILVIRTSSSFGSPAHEIKAGGSLWCSMFIQYIKYIFLSFRHPVYNTFRPISSETTLNTVANVCKFITLLQTFVSLLLYGRCWSLWLDRPLFSPRPVTPSGTQINFKFFCCTLYYRKGKLLLWFFSSQVLWHQT